jgi:hypothetical protein
VPSLRRLYFVNPAAPSSAFPSLLLAIAGAQITRSTASPVSGCFVSGGSWIDCRTSKVCSRRSARAPPDGFEWITR